MLVLIAKLFLSAGGENDGGRGGSFTGTRRLGGFGLGSLRLRRSRQIQRPQQKVEEAQKVFQLQSKEGESGVTPSTSVDHRRSLLLCRLTFVVKKSDNIVDVNFRHEFDIVFNVSIYQYGLNDVFVMSPSQITTEMNQLTLS